MTLAGTVVLLVRVVDSDSAVRVRLLLEGLEDDSGGDGGALFGRLRATSLSVIVAIQIVGIGS